MAKAATQPARRPLYEQIKILLTNSLVAGEWKPGEAIPSEMELAERYRVSQGTVRKAVEELASERILMRRQGKGTFVASHTEPAYQYRFLRLRPDSGERVHPVNLFFGLERGRAGAEIAHGLGLAEGAPITSFKRVMSFAGRPIVFDAIAFDAARFPGLTLAELEATPLDVRLYDPSGLGAVNHGAFITSLARTVGHFRGEGECTVRGL